MICVRKYSERFGTESAKRRVLFLPENIAEAMWIMRVSLRRGGRLRRVSFSNVCFNGDIEDVQRDIDKYLSKNKAPVLRIVYDGRKREEDYVSFAEGISKAISSSSSIEERRKRSTIEYSEDVLASVWNFS